MIQPETEMNFRTFIEAAKNDDVSLVSCKDAKGRSFDVIAVLCVDANDFSHDVYMPFAVMAGSNMYPLMRKIKPPENLKGEWCWDEE